MTVPELLEAEAAQAAAARLVGRSSCRATAPLGTLLAHELMHREAVGAARRAFGVVLGVMLAFSSSGTPMLLLRATRIEQGHRLNACATFERLILHYAATTYLLDCAATTALLRVLQNAYKTRL